MLAWLDRFFNSATSTIGTAVSNAVHWAIHAVAGVILSVMELVKGAWAKLVDAFHAFHRALDTFCAEIVKFAHYVIHVAIPRIYRWATAELAKLSSQLAKFYHQVVAWVDDLYKRIAAAVSSLTAWVVRDIWDPLKKYADLIWNDLLKWGFAAWKIVTNLPALADSLLLHLVTSLERQAFTVAKLLGRFTLALLHTQLKTIIATIEEILTAVI